MALIGISGKIGSGKDSVAIIIQGLNMSLDPEVIVHHVLTGKHFDKSSGFEIKSFAYKLKQIVSLLIGCTMEQLEDREFKDKELGEEWTRYAYVSGFTTDNNGNTSMLTTDCDKERYELELRAKITKVYKVVYTPRLLMIRIGTNCFRDTIHPNIHINGLFAGHKPVGVLDNRGYKKDKVIYPDWIVKDVRFPNEAKAIKDKRGSFLIRVNRPELDREVFIERIMEYDSEPDLDNYEKFDYVIDNNGSILDLIAKVKNILIKENIL